MKENLTGAGKYRRDVEDFVSVAAVSLSCPEIIPTISTAKGAFPPVLASYLLSKMHFDCMPGADSLHYACSLSQVLMDINQAIVSDESLLLEALKHARGNRSGFSLPGMIFDLIYGALQFLAYYKDERSREVFLLACGLAGTAMEKMRRSDQLSHVSHFKVHAAVFLSAESTGQAWDDLCEKTQEFLESWGESPVSHSVITHSAHNLFITCKNIPESDRVYDMIKQLRRDSRKGAVQEQEVYDVLNGLAGWRESSEILRILWPELRKSYYRYNRAETEKVSSAKGLQEAAAWAVNNGFVSSNGEPCVKGGQLSDEWLLSFPGGYTIGHTCVLCRAGNACFLFDYGCDEFGRLPEWTPDMERIDAVFISHAHRDHVAGLPRLYLADGYTGPWYATRKTCDLARLTLRDHVRLSNSLPGYSFPVTNGDVERIMSKCICIGPGQNVPITEEISVRAYGAGHVAGSCQFLLSGRDTSVLYTGDYNTQFSYSVDPMENPDEGTRDKVMALVTEGTYAFREDPIIDARMARSELLEEIRNAGTFPVLLPVLSLGRAQEVLKALSGSGYAVGVFGLAQRMTLASGVTYEDNIVFEKRRAEDIEREDYDIIVASAGCLQGGPSKIFSKEKNWRGMKIIFSGYLFPGTPARGMVERGEASLVRYSAHTPHVNWFSYLQNFPNADKFVIHYPGNIKTLEKEGLLVPHQNLVYPVKKSVH